MCVDRYLKSINQMFELPTLFPCQCQPQMTGEVAVDSAHLRLNSTNDLNSLVCSQQSRKKQQKSPNQKHQNPAVKHRKNLLSEGEVFQRKFLPVCLSDRLTLGEITTVKKYSKHATVRMQNQNNLYHNQEHSEFRRTSPESPWSATAQIRPLNPQSSQSSNAILLWWMLSDKTIRALAASIFVSFGNFKVNKAAVAICIWENRG